MPEIFKNDNLHICTETNQRSTVDITIQDRNGVKVRIRYVNGQFKLDFLHADMRLDQVQGRPAIALINNQAQATPTPSS